MAARRIATINVAHPELVGRPMVATHEFVYNGRTLEIGELFELGGFRNDPKLTEVRYARNRHPDDETADTGRCEHCEGKAFCSPGYRALHYARQHNDQPSINFDGLNPAHTNPVPPAQRDPGATEAAVFGARGEI